MGEINLPLENELMQQPCHKAVHDGASPDGDVKSFWCVWYSKPFFILCYLTSDFAVCLNSCLSVCVCLFVIYDAYLVFHCLSVYVCPYTCSCLSLWALLPSP